MSENLRQFTKAVYGMEHVVRLVPADAWDNASPCAGWTSRDVLGHAIGVLRMVDSFARDQPLSVDAMNNPGTIAGSDPAAAWASARDDVLEALDHPGVLHKVVASPFGEMPVDNLINLLLGDTLTHSWDLGRAAGVDERLDPGLVGQAHATLEPLSAALRAPGVMDAEITPLADADAQTRFLNFTGRAV